ncbi:MAG: valine--tRNA ligase [Candidatus Omnitrophica bacterium]|nr:valine--tRNA ligase [Candidatus Omnitrophota bacterium]
MKELSKRFDFKSVDHKWSEQWVLDGTYHAKARTDKKPYTIVIPPPNVTGILHMGHALNNTLQDIIIRYKRMNGFESLWMPGTDHAGIATQNVVEKKLAKEGKTRQDVGREHFIEHLWQWKQEYGDTIIHQLKKLGASCDWDRARFTMDDGYSEAVKKVFVDLYHKGLIYQDTYIINWCPRCQTALSDEEAEHQELQGSLTYIKYPLKNNPDKFLTVATTRPETMLGDTAVAVNPHDERYLDFIGQTLILPLMDREIPVIADEFVDPNFGTGAVKVTPAHDPNDYAMGQRHQLNFINVLHPNGVINENGGPFNGLDRFEARQKIVSSLKENGFYENVEQHTHSVGHCYRCHTVVEPYLSKQWFVKMKPLAEPAIKVVNEGKVKFYPQRWSKVYMNWMENIRDWCISRQIWWGHRIPVWYDAQGNQYAAMNEEEALKLAKEKTGRGDMRLTQDEDVLDTWFSSWLWPFATLNWPEHNEDLKFFYPTNSLFTASEIIFFWVARMIMAGIEFMGDIPFEDVYIHGTVRDSIGRKMSKSLGNALDPLEIIEEYGADALRFSLIMNSGQDLYISKDKFEIGRNFANKVWNATRLVLMNIPEKVINENASFDPATLKGADIPTVWIISRFAQTIKQVSQAIEEYRYSEAENLIYEFFWNNFCDWYLEIIKQKWDSPDIQKVSFKILIDFLKILHPFMPFVTEEIWHNLFPEGGSIAHSGWPVWDQRLINLDKVNEMAVIIEAVTVIRTMRAQWKIKPQEEVTCVIYADLEQQKLFEHNLDLFQKLARVNKLSLTHEETHPKNSASAVIQGGIRCILPLGHLIDLNQEIKRLDTQLKDQLKAADSLSKRLSNQGFLAKAPENVVQKEKERLENLTTKIAEIEKILQQIS